MAIEFHVETDCAAPREQVFAYIANYRNIPEWFYGIQKFVPTTEQDYGLGAIFEGSVTVGATLHSTVEVTGFEENLLIELNSIKGFKNTSTWSFQEAGADLTRIVCDFSYSLPGGVAGKALGKVIEPFVKIAIKHTSESLAKHAAAA